MLRYINQTTTYITIAFLLLCSVISHAHAQQGIRVKQATVKITPPSIENSAAYFYVMNDSDEERILVNAKSDAAKRVEIHKHSAENGMMRMHKVEKIFIPAGGITEFKPGGYHIMLIGVNQPIAANDIINITLIFANGETKTIAAKAIAKAEAGKHHQHSHNHH